MRPSGVHHVAVKVVDLARAEPFYRELLGLPVVRRWPAETGRGERSVWLDAGRGTFIALEVACSVALSSPEDGAGLHLVALGIGASERRAWVERFVAAGVEIYRRTPFTLYVRDPEGNRVALSHYPEPAPDADDHL